MKITGGKFKNISLHTFKNALIRPTLSVIRQAIFNICQEEIINANFLDIFSGTGIMGLEALSRGANFCTFIDKNKKSIDLIKKNINKLSIENTQVNLINKDANTSIRHLTKSYDIIFMDPPYNFINLPTFLNNLISNAIEKKIFASNAFIFIERKKKISNSNLITEKSLLEKIHLLNIRAYGNSTIEQYQYIDSSSV